MLSELADLLYAPRHNLATATELLEGLGIGERLGVAHLAAVHHVGDGQFTDLVAAGSRDVADGGDASRDMARSAEPPPLALDPRIARR